MKKAFPGDKMKISAEDWNRVRQNIQPVGVRARSNGFIYSEIALAYTGAGGIPARSGATLGSATVTFYDIDDSAQAVASTQTETAYNITLSAVNGNTYIVVGRENRTLKWLVLVEDCGAGGS